MDKTYSQIYSVDLEKKEIYPHEIKSADNYLKSLNINIEKPTRNSDKEIYKLSASDKLNCDPILCLRCRVSMAIYFECKEIYVKYKKKGVDLFDLSRIALVDDGRKNLRIINGSGKIKKYLINFSFLENKLQNIKIPLFLEIIRTFDFERSNLSTWTKRIVKGDMNIRNYMQEFDIKFIGTWARLADTSTKRIKNSLINYGINKSLLDELICLHQSYKSLYRESKKNHFAKYKTQLGWEPSQEFLKSLDPPQENKENLELIEKALSSLYQPKLESIYSEKDDSKIQEIEFFQSANENESKIRSLMESIKKSSAEVIREILKADKKKWNKDKERKKCWILYSKGMSQREIAEKCNHKQGWVSKLIRENFIGELIANEVLIAIKNKKEFINITKLPDKLDYTKTLIKNQLLSLEQITNRSFLMQIVEEELNK